jgi:geranylgeranyl diphosphate synthase type II
MHTDARIEAALERALTGATSSLTPPRLSEATHRAVFPGGARLRPRLALAVARAHGDPRPPVTDAAAVAVELIHCASLVHDDLPCFDDSDERRGQPTLHKVYGEPLAVLVGDGLIVGAFDVVAAATEEEPRLGVALTRALARGVGLAGGIVAGQAWESEPSIPLRQYHRAKTGALFEAAAAIGALAAGAEVEPWRRVGTLLGDAYQIADDLADVAGSRGRLGKPVNRDAALGRGNEGVASGADGALRRFRGVLAELTAAIPPCRGRGELTGFVAAAATRLLPEELDLRVA